MVSRVDNTFWEILGRRYATDRTRHDRALADAFQEEATHASIMGQLRSGRYAVVLEGRAVDNIERRAEALLALVDAGVEKVGGLWTTSMGEAAKSFAEAELHTDYDSIEARLRDRLKILGNPPLNNLRNSLTRAEERLHAEIDLRVHAQSHRQLPIEEKLGAPRYDAALAGWRAAAAAAARADPDPGDVARAAVAAVEQLARVVNGTPAKTLGEIIGDLKRTGRVQAPLLKSLEEIWGWASNESGVRHGAAVPGEIEQSAADYVMRVSEAAMHLLLDIDSV